MFTKIPLFVLLLSQAFSSCKHKTGLNNPTNDPTIKNSVESNGESFPSLQLNGNSGFYVRVCDANNECFTDLIDQTTYSPQGLNPGTYQVEIYKCESSGSNFSCNNKIAETSIVQAPYHSPDLQNYLAKKLDIQVKQKQAAYSLFTLLDQHKGQVKTCIGSQSLETNNPYQAYLTKMDLLLKQDPIVAINGLAIAFNNDSMLNSANLLNAPSQDGLGLVTYTARNNVRVILFSEFPPGTTGIQSYQGVAASDRKPSYSSLRLEKRNPDGTWTLYREISSSDINPAIQRAVRPRREIELPALTEADLVRFETWARKQAFIRPPNSEIDQELARRAFWVSRIAGFLIQTPDDIKQRFQEPHNRKVLADAIQRRKDIADKQAYLDEVIAFIDGGRTGLEDIRRSLVTSLASLNAADQIWFRTLSFYDGALPGVGQLENGLNNYLDAEFNIDRLKVNQGRALELLRIKNVNLHTIRSLLLLPPNIDLERYAFNFASPWELLPLDDIFIKYHGFDPRDPAAWLHFRTTHQAEMLKQLDLSYRYTQWRPTDEAYRDIDSGTAFTWEQYRDRLLSPCLVDYSNAVKELHSKGEVLPSTDTKLSSSAIADSLKVLYRNEAFRAGGEAVSAGVLEQRAQALSEGRPLKGNMVVQIIGTLTAIGTIGAVSAVSYEASKKLLNLSDTNTNTTIDDCIEQAKEQFYKNSEPVFEQLKAYDFFQRILDYFSQKN